MSTYRVALGMSSDIMAPFIYMERTDDLGTAQIRATSIIELPGVTKAIVQELTATDPEEVWTDLETYE